MKTQRSLLSLSSHLPDCDDKKPMVNTIKNWAVHCEMTSAVEKKKKNRGRVFGKGQEGDCIFLRMLKEEAKASER